MGFEISFWRDSTRVQHGCKGDTVQTFIIKPQVLRSVLRVVTRWWIFDSWKNLGFPGIRIHTHWVRESLLLRVRHRGTVMYMVPRWPLIKMAGYLWALQLLMRRTLLLLASVAFCLCFRSVITLKTERHGIGYVTLEQGRVSHTNAIFSTTGQYSLGIGQTTLPILFGIWRELMLLSLW